MQILSTLVKGIGKIKFNLQQKKKTSEGCICTFIEKNDCLVNKGRQNI